jgi:cysteine desulfurase
LSCDCIFRKRIIDSKFAYDPKKIIYLDYNATTPVDPRVIGAYENACRNIWGNPSSLHIAGTKAWETIDAARTSISGYFGCTADEIKFCSSGSEAIHAAIWGILFRNVNLSFITTEIEHHAVKNIARHMKTAGREAVILKVDENGKIDRSILENELKKKPALVALSPVNHETGGVQDVREIHRITDANGSLLFLDGVQASCRLEPGTWTPFCDMFCVSGHKIYAPKGSAFLWSKKGLRLSSFRFGGVQQNGVFPGTENLPGIMSLAATVDLMGKEFSLDHSRLSTLTSEGFRILQNEFPDIVRESPPDHVPGILNISLPWIKNIEELIFQLSKNNICISRFSACSHRVSGSSTILVAMKRPVDRASTSLRISFGRWSKREDFFYLVNALKKVRNF